VSVWTMPPITVRHPAALWRDRADATLVSAFFHDGQVGWEELPARRISHRQGDGSGLDRDAFEICCIPFFSEPEAPGDIVTDAPEAPGLVAEIDERGDFTTIRVWAKHGAAAGRIEDALTTRGWLYERHADLLAVARLSDGAGDESQAFLDACVEAGEARWAT
jgi:Domain of unknown function (DUF4265)